MSVTVPLPGYNASPFLKAEYSSASTDNTSRACVPEVSNGNPRHWPSWHGSSHAGITKGRRLYTARQLAATAALKCPIKQSIPNIMQACRRFLAKWFRFLCWSCIHCSRYFIALSHVDSALRLRMLSMWSNNFRRKWGWKLTSCGNILKEKES